MKIRFEWARFSVHLTFIGWLKLLLTAAVLEMSADPVDPRVGLRVVIAPDPSELPATSRAQAEPHIARSPINPDILLATFQEGRFTNGGAVTCGYAHSTNGGLSWTRALLPQLTRINGGPFDRATDPVAAFDGFGNAYVCTLGLLGDEAEFGVVLVSRSTNAGETFGPPVEVFRPPNSAIFPDKNWFAVNQRTSGPFAGRIAVTFTRFAGSVNPLAISTSDDHGASWTVPRLFTPASGTCQGSQPMWLADNSLGVVYWNFRDIRLRNDDSIEWVRSLDGGASFGAEVAIRSGVRMFDASLVRDGSFLPSAAAARNSGELVVAYQAFDSMLLPRIFFQRSTNSGVSWSEPRPVSDNIRRADTGLPQEPFESTGEVFNPAIDVSPDGWRVVLTFFDSRVRGLPFVDTFAAESFDGGITWSPNLRLTDKSTDVRLAPLTDTGYMLGDYVGVVAPTDTNTAAIAISMIDQGGGIDPVAIRWGMAPGLTFASWRAARWSHADIQNPAIATIDSDLDRDGFPLLTEYIHGLDPARADSANSVALKIERVVRGQIALSTVVRPGMTDFRFQLERQPAIGLPWLPLTTPVVPEGLEDQITLRMVVPTTDSMELFRYRVEAAEPGGAANAESISLD